jgi:PAS domain S-box-containing protein
MRFSIRAALIIGFLVLIWGTFVVTTTSSFLSSQTVLNRHARDIMENIADLAMEQSQNHLAHAHAAAALTRRLLTANVVESSEKNFQALEQYFLDQLALYPHFAGIYIGKPNGDFYYVSRSSERSAGGFRTKLTLNRNNNKKTSLIWRDENMNFIGDELDVHDSYDPRTRPWYKKAQAKQQIAWSDPYIFFTSKKPGITIAGPMYDESGRLKAIVGVDIEIDQLSTFIAHLNIGKNGRAFMINNNGDVVAFYDLEKIKTNGQSASSYFRLVKIQELDDILCRKAFAALNLKLSEKGRYTLKKSRFATFEHNGHHYHAMLTPFSIAQWPWIIGIHLPEDDYLGELKENRLFNVLLTLVISAVATIIALFFSHSISRPITNLEKEAVAVKNNDMQTRFDIRSGYKEIQETADSFRLMKNAIKESTERYQGIFENIQDVYYEITLDGTILEISPSIKNITNHSREQLIGSNVASIYVDPSGREALVEELLKNRQVQDYEIVRRDNDRGSGCFSINAVLKTDDSGTPVKIIGSMRDISARKKSDQELLQYREHLEELVKERTADLEQTNTRLLKEQEQRLRTETALGENEEKYRNILESIEDGYFETNLRGNLTFINEATCRILGRSKSELLGLHFRNYLDRRDVRKAVSIFREIHVTTKPRKAIELWVNRKDRKKRYIELSVSQIRNANGQPVGFRGLGRDSTERLWAEKEKKRLEEHLQQVQRLRAIGTLAGGIAHDFNNMLMGIQGNVSLLLMSTDVTEESYEHLRSIESCVQSGANLTRQLLGYARGGKYVVKPTNLNEIVTKSSTLFGRTKKEIKIVGKYQKDLWTAEVDRNQIEQVLVNLFLNAWQAMQPGGTISLKTENVILDNHFVRTFQASPGRYVKISVKDNGKGMDAETKIRIFEPFFTTKAMGKGTGLGLASAFGIIQNHNGIIDVESELGKGTTYYIYLPVSDKPISAEIQSNEGLQHGHETILIVDDEKYILDTCKAMLTKIGYRILTAQGGKEAIETVRNERSGIDLVILDMIMPDMDGVETYDQLKQIDPQIKVVLSSGYSFEDIAEEILERGCADFIQKPFNLMEISERIKDILGRKPDKTQQP